MLVSMAMLLLCNYATPSGEYENPPAEASSDTSETDERDDDEEAWLKASAPQDTQGARALTIASIQPEPTTADNTQSKKEKCNPKCKKKDGGKKSGDGKPRSEKMNEGGRDGKTENETDIPEPETSTPKPGPVDTQGNSGSKKETKEVRYVETGQKAATQERLMRLALSIAADRNPMASDITLVG